MKITCQKVVINTFDEIEEDIVFIKNDIVFIGALFFKKDSFVKIEKVLKEEVFESDDTIKSDIVLVKNVFNFYMQNCSKLTNDTLKTLQHWQFMNNFSRFIIDEDKYSLPIVQKFLSKEKRYSIMHYEPISDNVCFYSIVGLEKVGFIDKKLIEDCNSITDLEKNSLNIKFKDLSTNKIIENPREVRKISLENLEIVE